MIGRRIYIITGARTMSGIGALALRCLFHTLYAIDMGYVPVIDLKHYPNQYYKDKRVYKDNVWEYYFEQPFNLSLEDICDEDDVVISDNAFCPQTGILKKHPLFYPKDILSIRALKIKNRMNKYLKFNGETERFANERCERILKGNKNVLGVLLRGTDYTLKQSYDEFIQPKTDKVIGDVKKFLKEKGYEKIYLATEDINIYQAFKNEFKDLLLENPQYMYSTNYDKRKFLSEIKVERENHNYMLGLEYLASLYILSKCRGFIGGLAGGTRIAYIMSEKWDDFRVYDLGQYGKYNSIAERIFSVKNLETTVNSHRVFTIFGIKIKINKNSKPKWYVKLKRLEAVFNYRRRYDKDKKKGGLFIPA